MEVGTEAEDALMDFEDRPPPPPELLAFLETNPGYEEAHFWIPGCGWEVPGPDGDFEADWMVVPASQPGAQGEEGEGEGEGEAALEGAGTADHLDGEDLEEGEVPNRAPGESEEAVYDISGGSAADNDPEGAEDQPEVAGEVDAVGQVELLDRGVGEDAFGEGAAAELAAPGFLAVSSDPYDCPAPSDEEAGDGAEAAGAGAGAGAAAAQDAAPREEEEEDDEEADWGGGESDADAEKGAAGDSAETAGGSRGGGKSGDTEAAAVATSCSSTTPVTQSWPGPSTGSKPSVPQVEIIISDDEDDSGSVPKLHAAGPASGGAGAAAVGQGTPHRRPSALRTTAAAAAPVPRELRSLPAPPPKPATPPAPPRPAVGREEADLGQPDAKRPRLAAAAGSASSSAPGGPGTPVAPRPPPPSPRLQPAAPPGAGAAAKRPLPGSSVPSSSRASAAQTQASRDPRSELENRCVRRIMVELWGIPGHTASVRQLGGLKHINDILRQLQPEGGPHLIPYLLKLAKKLTEFFDVQYPEGAPPVVQLTTHALQHIRQTCASTQGRTSWQQRHPNTAQPAVPPAKALPSRRQNSSSHQWTPPPAATSAPVGEGACSQKPQPQPTSNAQIAVKSCPILPQRPAVPKPPAPPSSSLHQGASKHEAAQDQAPTHEVKLLPREPAYRPGRSSSDRVRLVSNAKVQSLPKAAGFACDDRGQSADSYNGVTGSSMHSSITGVHATTSHQPQEGSTPSDAVQGCPPKTVPATLAPAEPASARPAPAKPARPAQAPPSNVKPSHEVPKSVGQMNPAQIRPRPPAAKGAAMLPSHSAGHLVRPQERVGAPPAGTGGAAPSSGGVAPAIRPPQRNPGVTAQAGTGKAAVSAPAVRSAGPPGAGAAPGAAGGLPSPHLDTSAGRVLDGPRPPAGPPPPAVLASAGDSGGKGRPYIGSIRRVLAPRSAKGASGVGRPQANPGHAGKMSAAQGHLKAHPFKTGFAKAFAVQEPTKGGGKAATHASTVGAHQGTKAHSTDGRPVLTDNEGRPFDLQRVVVNFANVGSTFGERVLKRNKSKVRLFDYEGVRRCVKHLTEKLGLSVIGVVYENYRAVSESGQESWEVPTDIAAMCETIELTPRLSGQQHKSADDEMTIKCAYRRNCYFLDNDNYHDWRGSLRDENARKWLEECQDYLQMRYYFDTGLGTFDTLDGNLSFLRPEPARGSMKRPWGSG